MRKKTKEQLAEEYAKRVIETIVKLIENNEQAMKNLEK